MVNCICRNCGRKMDCGTEELCELCEAYQPALCHLESAQQEVDERLQRLLMAARRVAGVMAGGNHYEALIAALEPYRGIRT